jgi:hypothetical protein
MIAKETSSRKVKIVTRNVTQRYAKLCDRGCREKQQRKLQVEK